MYCVYCVYCVHCVYCMYCVYTYVCTPGLLGVDLMLPGVVGPDQGGGDYRTLVKGQVCGVNLAGNR